MKFFKKTKKKLEKYPAYVTFLKLRDEIAACIMTALLTCLNTVSPVWNFLFVKKQNPNRTNQPSNKIS